jgi:hypothetical protein
MNNPTTRANQTKKSLYNKPAITELNASAGTQGMGVNMLGMLKNLIGPEGGGGMDSPS